MRVLLVTNMYPTQEQPAFGTFIADQVTALRKAGVEMDVLLINGRKNSLNYLWGVFRLWWMLLKKRYHLIHAHYAMSGFIARLQWLYPLVVTYHGAEVKDYVPVWLRYIARRGQKIFNRVIVVCQEEKDLMVGPTDRVRVIPGGIDFDAFRIISQQEARQQLNLPPDKPLILWAGEHWQPVKRFELVKGAVEILKERCPDVELVLVSGQPHTVIPLYMNACDVLALTSFSEGSPTVVKEALACNLPVVSTDVGDVAEMIGGVAGCYLVEADVNDIAEKLFKVLQTRQRTRGREKIQHLSGDAIAQRVVAVYNEVCPPPQRIKDIC